MSRVSKSTLRRQLSRERIRERQANIALNAFRAQALLESIELKRPAPDSKTFHRATSICTEIGARRCTQASTNADDAEQSGEKLLRLFDLNPRFGPYLGIERITRWKRAKKLGLEPALQVLRLIKQHANILLREFDLNPRYGPHMGISRQERWQRAKEFGLEPPVAVKHFLEDVLVEEQPPESKKLHFEKLGLQSIRSLSVVRSGHTDISRHRPTNHHALELTKPLSTLSSTSRNSMSGAASGPRCLTTEEGALHLDGLTEHDCKEKSAASLLKKKRQHRKQKPTIIPVCTLKNKNVFKRKRPPLRGCGVLCQGRTTQKVERKPQRRCCTANPNRFPVDMSANTTENKNVPKRSKRALQPSDRALPVGLHEKQRAGKAVEGEDQREADQAAVLRQLDLAFRFGPYGGVQRLTQWRRSGDFGLNPPPKVLHFVETEENETLRMFDLNPRYGPFLGIDRLERWIRAKRFGLQPPEMVKCLIEEISKPQAPRLNQSRSTISRLRLN